MSSNGLLRCPKNLKECIDWILRATGKDNGSGNDTDKLKDAVKGVLKGSGNDLSKEIEGLSSGLALFMGYPSCVCKLKKSVEERLKDISKELIKESESVEGCLNNLKLNCDKCRSNGVCRCCVIECISEVEKCQCVKQPSKKASCHCNGGPISCAKLLSDLKDCLSMHDLQSDLSGCECKPSDNCCQNGQACNTSCPLCKPGQNSTMTGLGLCRPSPVRLAEKLEGFFGPGTQSTKSQCDCQCIGSTSDKSCCCLACDNNQCSQSCGCKSQCSCAQTQTSKGCPRKTFCNAINGLKVASNSTEMKCCEGGTKCHCQLQNSGSSCQSDCNTNKSVKCLIRRLVSYFKGLKLDSSSNQKFFKSCCELICVSKTCHFLDDFLRNKGRKGNKDECGKCTSGAGGQGGTCNGSSSSNGKSCCNGTISNCNQPECCQGCEDCNAIKFRKALNELRYSGPCGNDLWRTLDGFLYYCFRVFLPYANQSKDFLKTKVKNAQEKCSERKSGTSSPCTCPDCAGCKKLLEDSTLKSLLTHGYVSSFAGASWEKLCPNISGQNCCCGKSSCSCQSFSSCPCQSSVPCNPSKCCEDCPKKKAAKIFLGLLPAIYYGLKIVYDRAKDPSTWPRWDKLNRGRDLGRFLFAWGYEPEDELNAGKPVQEIYPLLDSLFNGSSGIFDNLYKEVCGKYFHSSPSTSSQSTSKNPPKSVREMLLWLSGLRFTSGFKDLVSHCKPLCAPLGTSFNHDAFCYYIHTSCFFAPTVVCIIQDPDSPGSFISSSQDCKDFCYPEDPSDLFYKLFEYVNKMYVQLRFLQLQCQHDQSKGGWAYCYYGQGCAEKFQSSSTPVTPPSPCCTSGSKGYLCVYSVHTSCSTGSCSSQCPHPLQAFLCDSDSHDSKSLFKPPPGFPKMGFTKFPEKSSKNGSAIFAVLRYLCGSGYLPLTRLAQFLLCVSKRPPESLADIFAFFYRLRGEWDKSIGKSNKKVKDALKDFIDSMPGSYSGSAFRDAIDKARGSNKHTSGSHADLWSLRECSNASNGSTCAKYMDPLVYDAYELYAPDFVSTYVSSVCYLAPKLKDLLEELKRKFETCCLNEKCSEIVTCPCALPALYRFGFTFYSPGTLNCVNNYGKKQHSGKDCDGTKKGQDGCTLKSCKDFLEQLEKVIEGDPFQDLLSAIDSLIWFLRYPFILFVLALWSFVIYYYLYAHLYKLDTPHIRSHLHFPKTFKIPPATLLSGSSSKLKDLSYFGF